MNLLANKVKRNNAKTKSNAKFTKAQKPKNNTSKKAKKSGNTFGV